MTWVQTHSGVAFDLLEPKPEMVRIEDIAHALSRINRFSGHTLGEPYSVAHHSMLVADLLASWGAPPVVVREGLLHDAGEAYYGDTVSPVKMAVRLEWIEGDVRRDSSALDRLALRVDRVVRHALSLPPHESPIVKRADLVALAIERRDLMAACERDWELPEYAPTSAPCGRLYILDGCERSTIVPEKLCSWAVARSRFLALLAELDAKIAGHS